MPTSPDRNRLQRAYFAWAERFYRRMSPELAAEARRLDEFLYSRRALGFWVGTACALLGSTLLTVYGIWQCEGEVRHLVARTLVDHSLLLQGLASKSRNFR